MAITKIIKLRKSVLNSIRYITDSKKTQGEYYVSSFNCGVHTADLEFELTASMGTGEGSIKALHLIQSFVPGEVDPATAHEIGRQLVMEFTRASHEFVLATHIDKDHIHNHAVINNVSFVDHHKFRQPPGTLDRLQSISDRLCAMHGLYVMDDPQNQSDTYPKEQHYPLTHRKILKDKIDALIPGVTSIDELFDKLANDGYDIKGSFPSYSFKSESAKLYTNISDLGERYTTDALISRIGVSLPDSAENPGILKDLSDRLQMIKEGKKKDTVSPALIKRLTVAYDFLSSHCITTMSELKKTKESLTESVKDKHDRIHEMEKEIDRLKSICEHLKRKEQLNNIYASYLRSGRDQTFRDAHLKEIKLFEASCIFLLDMNVDPTVRYSESFERLGELIKTKDSHIESYRMDVDDLKQLKSASKNISLFLSQKTDKKNKDISRDIQ
ncbi:MAG: relaxase/mobilization nuclease domain-containing protein [Lachnospiraceae bacterium]|nr:relaxase/mobilization nuclease domain-containing protein [Lachnospiraceae bacterium]